MPSSLFYHDTEIKLECANYDFAYIVDFVVMQDSLLHIELQPGDGTKYDLLVMGARDFGELLNMSYEQGSKHLIVVVCRSNTPDTIALYGPANYGAEKKLYPGNAWAQTFLKWWLDNLLEAIN